VTDSDKHTSLLRYEINYALKRLTIPVKGEKGFEAFFSILGAYP